MRSLLQTISTLDWKWILPAAFGIGCFALMTRLIFHLRRRDFMANLTVTSASAIAVIAVLTFYNHGKRPYFEQIFAFWIGFSLEAVVTQLWDLRQRFRGMSCH
jgi:hypothetical protein